MSLCNRIFAVLHFLYFFCFPFLFLLPQQICSILVTFALTFYLFPGYYSMFLLTFEFTVFFPVIFLKLLSFFVLFVFISSCNEILLGRCKKKDILKVKDIYGLLLTIFHYSSFVFFFPQNFASNLANYWWNMEKLIPYGPYIMVVEWKHQSIPVS